MVVVSHTHWDREWYLSFQQFRARLVAMTLAPPALKARSASLVGCHCRCSLSVVGDKRPASLEHLGYDGTHPSARIAPLAG